MDAEVDTTKHSSCLLKNTVQTMQLHFLQGVNINGNFGTNVQWERIRTRDNILFVRVLLVFAETLNRQWYMYRHQHL